MRKVSITSHQLRRSGLDERVDKKHQDKEESNKLHLNTDFLNVFFYKAHLCLLFKTEKYFIYYCLNNIFKYSNI